MSWSGAEWFSFPVSWAMPWLRRVDAPGPDAAMIPADPKIALCTLSLSMGNIETRDDPYESVGIGEVYDISSEKWLNWGL